MESYLIEEIIQVTGDAKSRAFWEKAVRVLGENIVASEFSELKYQMQTKAVHEPSPEVHITFESATRKCLCGFHQNGEKTHSNKVVVGNRQSWRIF